MRIAYLTGEYPRATDTFIQREVAALRQLGVEVHTFAIRRPAEREIIGAEQEAERQCTFYILPTMLTTLLRSHLQCVFDRPRHYLRALGVALKTRPPGLYGLVYQIFYFAEAAILACEIRTRQIEHLHNHFANSSCSVAMLAAEMGGFPYSFTMHGPAIFFEPKYWRIDEKIRRASFVNCISYFCRSQAMVFASRDIWPRLHIVHCGVDPQQYIPVTHKGEGHRILYVGRLAAVKGLPVLLEALAMIRQARPNIMLTIAGDGPDRSNLEQMSRELNLQHHVRFVGYCSQAQVREHLKQTDVFVMSSFAEGVPVVLMEALASGVPVVATRIAGVGELVENGISGFTVPPGNPVSLAEAIERLLDDPTLRQQFGRNGRRHVEEHFDIRREAARLLQIMIAARNGCRAPVRPDASPMESSRTGLSPQHEHARTWNGIA